MSTGPWCEVRGPHGQSLCLAPCVTSSAQGAPVRGRSRGGPRVLGSRAGGGGRRGSRRNSIGSPGDTRSRRPLQARYLLGSAQGVAFGARDAHLQDPLLFLQEQRVSGYRWSEPRGPRPDPRYTDWWPGPEGSNRAGGIWCSPLPPLLPPTLGIYTHTCSLRNPPGPARGSRAMRTDPKDAPTLPGSDCAARLSPGKEAGAGMGETGSRTDHHPLFFPLGTTVPAPQSYHSTSVGWHV